MENTYCVTHYHHDTNYRGRNPEIFTDLTKTQALRIYHKHLKDAKYGDTVVMRKTMKSIWL